MGAAAETLYKPFHPQRSHGWSDEALFVAEQMEAKREHWQESYVLGQQVRSSLNELDELFETCREPGWDGYEAQPIALPTFELTRLFLNALPIGIPGPSVGAEPDGDITLEWYRSPRRVLSVSVTSNFDLHYAALTGASKHYGTVPFFGEVPGTIMSLVYDIMAT